MFLQKEDIDRTPILQDRRTDGQGDSYIPPSQNFVCGGYNNPLPKYVQNLFPLNALHRNLLVYTPPPPLYDVWKK